MKQILILAVFVIAAAAQSAVASAQGDQAKHQKCKDARQAKMLAAGDTNRDGALSSAEREALHAKKRADRLARFDADGDGTLNKKERGTARHEHLVAKFESADSSGDAAISLAEAKATCGPLGRKFAEVDANGDNSISWIEFEAAAPKRGHHKRGGHHGKRGQPRK